MNKIRYFIVICIIFTIAVISGTYAYFSASKNVDNVVYGGTNTFTFSVNISKVTNNDSLGLLPMVDENISYAVRYLCEDDNQNAACQIFKVDVTNTGNMEMTIDGFLTLKTVTDSDEMRFVRIYENSEGNFCFSSNCSSDSEKKISIKSGIPKDGDFSRVNLNYEEDDNTVLVHNEYLGIGETNTYYFVDWLHDDNIEQSEIMGKEGFYNGSVSFTSSFGNNVTAIF